MFRLALGSDLLVCNAVGSTPNVGNSMMFRRVLDGAVRQLVMNFVLPALECRPVSRKHGGVRELWIVVQMIWGIRSISRRRHFPCAREPGSFVIISW